MHLHHHARWTSAVMISRKIQIQKLSAMMRRSRLVRRQVVLGQVRVAGCRRRRP
nr:hypothetical protein Iba_chr03cCG4650 [Ipomoea batatas]